MSREMISAIARDFNKNMCSDREVLESCTECAGSIENSPCLLYEIATRIYKAGYRKQSEGEWIDQYNGKYDNPIYVCSLCRRGTLLTPEIDNLENMKMIQALSPFCPNCGAHMRKEDEGK